MAVLDWPCCSRVHAQATQFNHLDCALAQRTRPAQAGELENDEIFYTDKRQSRDHECLSLGCDNHPVLDGRTPMQTYADFIKEFAHQCSKNDLWGEPHPYSAAHNTVRWTLLSILREQGVCKVAIRQPMLCV